MAYRGDDTDPAGDFGPISTEPTDPTPTTSTNGTPPPWMAPGSVGPFAPGSGGWAASGPQIDPQGQTWTWNPGSNAWERQVTATTDPGGVVNPGPGPAPAPAPIPGSIGGLLAPFTPPAERFTMPGTPVFTPPAYTPYERFVDPSMEDVRSDPGYEFARSEGQRGLEASKAAGGTLNTGGTLKDILAWGNNYATQRYGDVRNRKMDTYLTNYKTQNIDPYEKQYRGALDAFAPQMTGYATQSSAAQRGNELDWSHAYDMFRDQRDSTYNKTYQYLTT